MSLGLRIKAVCSMLNVDLVPKAGCTSSIGGIMLVGNTDGVAPSSNIDACPGA